MLASLALTAFLGCAPDKDSAGGYTPPADFSGNTGIPVVEIPRADYASGDIAVMIGQAPTGLAVSNETSQAVSEYNNAAWDAMWQGSDPDAGSKVALVNYSEDPAINGVYTTQVTMLYNDNPDELQGYSTVDFFGPADDPLTLKAVGGRWDAPGADFEMPVYLAGGSGESVPVENAAAHFATFVTGSNEENPELAVVATTEYDPETDDVALGVLDYWLNGGFSYATVTDDGDVEDFNDALWDRVGEINRFGAYAVGIDSSEDPYSSNTRQVIVILNP